MDRISLFYDIGRYNEHGKVDKKHREVLFRENYKDKTESEISKMVDDVCDDKIDFYLKYGFDVVKA